MQFKRINMAVGRPILVLTEGDKIIAWVLITLNGTWTYDIVGVRHSSPRWMGRPDIEDHNACMIPYELSFATEHEAAMAVLKVFGD